MTNETGLQPIKRWFSKESGNLLTTSEQFTRLYEETHLFIFRYVYGLSGGPLQEAEDLAAETYTRAWKTRQRFRGDQQAALGWLLRIARNLVIDLSRRRKVRNVDEKIAAELLADPGMSPESDMITQEQIIIVWKMLHTLPDHIREMLVLRYMLGWQVKEIAAYLDMHENTVTVTIKRTIKNLQSNWRQE